MFSRVTVRHVQLGGMGFLHYNCSIQEQVQMLTAVKAHTPGCSPSVSVVTPDISVSDVKTQVCGDAPRSALSSKAATSVLHLQESCTQNSNKDIIATHFLCADVPRSSGHQRWSAKRGVPGFCSSC